VEQVQRQATAARQMPAHDRKRLPLQVDCQQMLERAEGDEHQAELPIKLQSAHVTGEQDEPPTCGFRQSIALLPRESQHALRNVNAGDVDAVLCQRSGYAAAAARQLKHWRPGLARQLLVEADVPDDRRGWLTVERVVGADEERGAAFVERAHYVRARD